MIQVGTYTFDLSDPLVMAAMAGALLFLLMLILVIVTVRRAGTTAQAAQLLATQLGGLGHRVESISNGQQQLFGGLNSVTEAQAQQQAQTLKLMEQRLTGSECCGTKPVPFRPAHRAVAGGTATKVAGHRQGAGQYHQTVRRCSFASRHLVQQANARRVWRNSVERYCY